MLGAAGWACVSGSATGAAGWAGVSGSATGAAGWAGVSVAAAGSAAVSACVCTVGMFISGSPGGAVFVSIRLQPVINSVKMLKSASFCILIY